MKHLSTILLTVLTLCTASIFSHGKDPDTSGDLEIPSQPFVHSAPAYSQWVITFSYPQDAKEKSPTQPAEPAKPLPEYVVNLPRTITITKSGEILHEETVTVGGNRLENWQVHGDYYIKYPGKSYWSAYEKADASLQATTTRLGLILPDSGFRDIDWIGLETYAGKIKAGAGENLIFVPGGRTSVNPEQTSGLKALDALPKIAYIDAQSRLPVLLRMNGETRTFKFIELSSSRLELPSDLADEIKKGNEIRAQRNAAPQREY